MTGEHVAKTEAKSRSIRTLVQGAIVTGVAALASTTALVVGSYVAAHVTPPS
jgi:hypothetical protein